MPRGDQRPDTETAARGVGVTGLRSVISVTSAARSMASETYAVDRDGSAGRWERTRVTAPAFELRPYAGSTTVVEELP